MTSTNDRVDTARLRAIGDAVARDRTEADADVVDAAAGELDAMHAEVAGCAAVVRELAATLGVEGARNMSLALVTAAVLARADALRTVAVTVRVEHQAQAHARAVGSRVGAFAEGFDEALAALVAAHEITAAALLAAGYPVAEAPDAAR